MNSIQRKSHGVTCVQRFNPGDDFVQTRVIKTGKFNWIRFTEWHIQITHPLEGKKYILSVEFARRLKPRRGMEFHAAPQMKSINLAVFWNGSGPVDIEPYRACFETVDKRFIWHCSYTA